MFLEIRWRKPAEAGICYDPEGEFVQKYYDPDRDILFNPFDDRCPYWSPLLEGNRQNAAARAADWKMIAESFLPDRRHGAPNSDFFIDSARRILTRILEVARDLPSIIEILIREDLIDQVVAGTELAHLITPGAKGQRGGVLATLSEVGEALRLLPPREQCSKTLSLTEWAKRRKGWIFITAKHDNRDALRRFHAASINILMKRLLAADPEWARSNPCWVIIDEVHALGHLSALPTAIVEGRKHGLKIIVGTQNKTQIEEIYGRLAATMLACFHTKVIFRCNEPECARWLSDLIGEDETERPRLSTTASVPHHGRDSINYNTVTERRAVVSKEEIMAVGNLYGYWKYGSVVVMFRIEPLMLRSIAKSFVERKSPPVVSQTLRVDLPHENGKERPEIATDEPDDLDITF
jgi:type IV secretory pathway TraG/TraD family ATPase VirD4